MADQPDGPTDETLIAFVQGSLPPDETDRVAAEAARKPELAAEIALLRGIAGALAEEAREPAPGALGWARLSRAIDAEAPPARARRPLWQLAASAAAAVLLWQAVAVPIFSGREQPGYAPVSEGPAAGFAASVAFVPDAREAEMRELLREVGARVVDGPSAIGLWVLDFNSEAARDAGLARLQAADVVESAQAQ